MDNDLQETLKLCYANLRKKTGIDFSLRGDEEIKRIEYLTDEGRGSREALLLLRAETWIDFYEKTPKTPAELNYIAEVLSTILLCRYFIARGRTQNTVYTIL